MAKEELIQFEGLVTEILPDARYRVQLDAGHEIVAYTAGKMKKNRIKTLAGDRVTIEMSPYDLEKGRLIFRHKDERPRAAEPRVAHRRAAASSAAGKRSTTSATTAPQNHVVRAAAMAPASRESKNRARQDCFGGCFE
jgi:translation initiation factor IF-1